MNSGILMINEIKTIYVYLELSVVMKNFKDKSLVRFSVPNNVPLEFQGAVHLTLLLFHFSFKAQRHLALHKVFCCIGNFALTQFIGWNDKNS